MKTRTVLMMILSIDRFLISNLSTWVAKNELDLRKCKFCCDLSPKSTDRA